MHSRPRALALTILTLITLVSPAHAALYLWDGGGADDSMATANNWATNAAPSGGGNHLLQFIGPLRSTPYNLGMMFLSGIDFPSDSNHTAFTISGARLHVSAHGIQNWSGATQTINNAITLQGGAVDHSFTGESGFLVLDGDINLANGVMEVTGQFGEVRLNGTVTATSGGIDVGSGSTPGTLVLGGSILTDVDVHAGTLVIDTDQPQPDYTTIQFLNGTSFESRGTQNITQTLHLTGDVSYEGSGVLRSQATISGNGNLIVDGSTGAVLGLGPSNNISPFSGDVTVNQGRLELNGGGLIAQLDGTIEVGDGSGSAATARLVGPNEGVVANGAGLTVRSDGLVDLNGPITFSSLSLYGGKLVVDDQVTVDPIATGLSGRTAELDAPWAIPTRGPAYFIHTTDGAANPDLKLLQGAVGGGMLAVTGDGQVELNGNAAQGPSLIDVNTGTLTINRSGAGSILTFAEITAGTLNTQISDQLGSGCELRVNHEGVLDIGPNQEHIQKLTLNNAGVAGSGTLFLSDDLDLLDHGTVAPALSFTISSAVINTVPGRTFTAGRLDGTNVAMTGGGLAVIDEINSDFTVEEGTLRYWGLCDGELVVEDTLEIPRDSGWVVANGALACGPASNLVIEFDALGAGDGDSFVLVQANSISGSFASVEYPTAPADHFWSLEYTANQVLLHLEAIDFAVLDLKHGVNGQQGFLGEGLNGVASVDFTVQGFDDVQLCSVTVDSLRSPLSDSTVGIRLYDVWTGTLLASTQQFFAQTDAFESRTFPLDVVLQPGGSHRLVVYGAGDLIYQAYYPNRTYPYFQSTLVEINAAHRDRPADDIIPTTPNDGFPQFRLDLGPCNLTAAPPATPVKYELALNSWPNPFNPSTTVSFELPREGPVRVAAFDARGRRVATLVTERRPAGRFDVQWQGRDDNGRTLGSGVYFLKLSHPSGERVRRVTLIK